MSHGVKMFICCNAELSLSVTYLSLSVPHPLPGALGLFISNNHQLPCFLFFTLIKWLTPNDLFDSDWKVSIVLNATAKVDVLLLAFLQVR